MTIDQSLTQKLSKAGLRPTTKRLAIGGLLFDGCDKHVTAEDVVALARGQGVKVSLATIYNTLNHFAAAGLLKRISLDGERTFFDTNITDHHHFYREDEGEILDIPAEGVEILGLPDLGVEDQIRSVEVLVRVGRRPSQN